MDARVAKCMLVSKVLVADGIMTENEQEFLQSTMKRLGLTDEERRRVVELRGWDDAEPIVAALSDDDKRDFVQTLIEAAAADGKLTALETQAMKRITKALGLQ